MNSVSVYAVVENGVVSNLVLWDGNSDWTPPTGTSAYALPDGSSVGLGWSTGDGIHYVPPQAP